MMIETLKLSIPTFLIGTAGLVDQNTQALDWLTKTSQTMSLISTISITLGTIIGAIATIISLYFKIKDRRRKPDE